MPKVGVAIVVDDDFRRTAECRYCREPIGPHPFILRYLIEAPTDVIFEHLHCARLMSEAENALDLPRR